MWVKWLRSHTCFTKSQSKLVCVSVSVYAKPSVYSILRFVFFNLFFSIIKQWSERTHATQCDCFNVCVCACVAHTNTHITLFYIRRYGAKAIGRPWQRARIHIESGPTTNNGRGYHTEQPEASACHRIYCATLFVVGCLWCICWLYTVMWPPGPDQNGRVGYIIHFTLLHTIQYSTHHT